MRHRLISYPIFFSNEVEFLSQLFDLGLPCFHLRKPNASLEDIQCFLERIDEKYYNRIILHEQHILAREFSLKGIHLKEFKRIFLQKKGELIDYLSNYNGFEKGTAIHDPQDLDSLTGAFDYALVSPVFDSISKQNYTSNYNWSLSTKDNFSFDVIALGGISETTLKEAFYVKGFSEVALLGAVWGNLAQPITNYINICKKMNGLMP